MLVPSRHGCYESFGSLELCLARLERANNAPPTISDSIVVPFSTRYDANACEGSVVGFQWLRVSAAGSGPSLLGREADGFADPSSDMLLRGFLISFLTLNKNLVNLLSLQARSPNHSRPFINTRR